MSDTDRGDLELMETAARAAGALALEFFGSSPRRWNKHDDTVVTEADMALDKLLHERLTAARPDYGWLSEERPDDGSRHTGRRVFIADPIDGTRAFIDGDDQWVVSIGLVEAGSPVAGILYNPVRDELWSASTGAGAFRNGERLEVAAGVPASVRIAASKKALDLAGLQGAGFTVDRSFMKSLAYRLAKVADGTVDIALAAGGSADWDLAAALVIVQEAGAGAVYLDGEPIRLNGESLRHAPFIAARAGLRDRVVAGRTGQNPFVAVQE